MIKRLVDVVVASVGLLVVAPLIALAALAIKLDSPGPVFFRQERVGRNFCSFRIWKLRTMYVPSPTERRDVLSGGGDPRVTRVGRMLRHTKIDELPQLLNVLTGDMSLVGPRPELHRYVLMFEDDYREILRCRPGVTDLASLRYRDEAAILARAADPEGEYVTTVLPDKIRLAREYVARRSIVLDCKILVQSLWVIAAPGARRGR